MSILTLGRDVIPVYRWTSLRSVLNTHTAYLFNTLDKTKKPQIIESLLISLRKASKNVSEHLMLTGKKSTAIRIKRWDFKIDSLENNEIVVSTWGSNCNIWFDSNANVIFGIAWNNTRFVISNVTKENNWSDIVIYSWNEITFEEILLIANLINFVVWENVDLQSVNLFNNFDNYRQVFPTISLDANLHEFLNFLYRISTGITWKVQ